MKIQSFNHHYIVPNLHDFLFSVEQGNERQYGIIYPPKTFPFKQKTFVIDKSNILICYILHIKKISEYNIYIYI